MSYIKGGPLTLINLILPVLGHEKETRFGLGGFPLTLISF